MQAKTLELAIDDPGLLYGATVFTTVRVYQSLDSTLTNWVAHSDRLYTTIQFLGWKQPNWQRLRQGAELLKAHFPILRITLFPDGREWITGRFLPDNLTINQIYGIAASSIAGGQFQRSLPTYKTGNYLSAWWAKVTAQQLSTGEAILVDASGNWLETSTGNLWGWQDGSWWTPPLTAGILPGVVRSQLVNWLTNQNYQVREEPWVPQIVKDFEAIAYTNSVVEVVPIHTVWQGQEVGGKTNKLSYDPNHPGFKLLRQMFINADNE